MIQIRVWYTKDGAPERLMMTGHAGRGPYGQDVVCAAASALVETLMLGLAHVIPTEVKTLANQEGNVDLVFPSHLTPSARAVVDTILYGLKDLSDTEPRFVRWNQKFDTNDEER
ncbi:MAG: ribosomal-processing cysteine protease Prp [Firmicutes bacterium]|nr:ribosomal-processing cysteine protease Prp [Bacillota bacterium]MCL5970961.1 ribosomal-processing cysteine protease Prp [Bacillota bacterium]